MSGPELMLASATHEPVDRTLERLNRDGGWYLEAKWDGIRAAIQRTGGTLTIYNRRRADITHRYPDVVTDVGKEIWQGTLDGEIVVMGPRRPEFALAHLRDAQSSPRRIAALASQHRATFIPFDVLEAGGRNVRDQPYTVRHALLQDMVAQVPPNSPDGQDLWAFVRENQWEGLVAKRGTSLYLPGRSKAWLKLKSTHRISALVGGIVPGKGSRGPVGALELYLYDGAAQSLRAIGSVGSGMTDADLRMLLARIEADKATVVEVEYLEVSPSGQLRMPVFRGIRNDVAPEDCTVETLV